MKTAYLKPNAIAEPLISQWYAWSYLIPPATAARYLTQSQIPILESFVAAPQAHVSALKDPAMLGGPFLHYGPERLPDVQALLDQTKAEQGRLLALSEAIAALEALLAAHPPGESLEPLYAQVPEALRGFVELVYDAQHRGSIRFIEGLLYRSEYYDPARQSVNLQIVNGDSRSFVLSTPRLPGDSLQVQRPFSDRAWDRLFAMRHTPDSASQVAAALGLDPDACFADLFTQTPPRTAPPYRGDGVRIRYFGHACVLIETSQVSILIDPLVSYEQTGETPGLPRYSYADLPPTIDYALITHNHQDHVMLETLLQLRHKIRHLVVPQGQNGSLLDPSLKQALQQIGFDQVQTISELESLPLPDGEIVSIPVLGEHGDLNIATKTAYWVTVKGRSVLCAADSNNLDSRLYKHIRHLRGKLDLLFIGMECDGAPYTWAYGPLLPQPVPRQMAQTRRLDGSNAERAIALVSQLQPQQVYVYAMGQEPWLTFITSIQYTESSKPIQESNRLVAHCRQRGIQSDRLLGCKIIELTAATTQAPPSGRIPVKAVRPMDSADQPPAAQAAQPPIERQPHRSQMTPPPAPHLPTPVETLLQTLHRLDIRLWLDGDSLRCNVPKGAMTAEIKQQLQQHKPELIALLKGEAVEPPASEASQPGDWAQDRGLPEEIQPQGMPISGPPQRILLTGATGFLGAFLLQSLLRQTEAAVVCLVRAESEAIGRRRLEATLRDYGIWQEEFSPRITVLPGDLAQPNLGLSDADFAALAQGIDAVYHNGAWVHHVSPYSLLRPVNVLGTQTILRLACHDQPKPLHFTSTLSVLPPTPLLGQSKIYEGDPLAQYPAPAGGYNRTKWVAEQLVAEAGRRGLPVTIYRPGPVSGHSQTGAFNANDFLYRLMQGYVELGIAPEGEMPLDILPVDYVAQAMVYLSRQPSAAGQVFHLIHPQPASSDLLFSVCRDAGFPVQRVPYPQWHAQLMAIAQGQSDHPLYPLVSLFSARRGDRAEDPGGLEVPFDCRNAQAGLADAPFDLPPLNRTLFSTYLDALIQSGAIAAPALP
ncbi:MAG: thioester reductase domain-containing protein [Cyanobacteria bacterium P01_A01_bin.135]